MLLIPAIDLKNGQCVRLKQGRMDDATVFADDPVAMAGHWIAQGATRVHLVDLDGAFAGTPRHAEVIRAITQAYPDVAIQVGGGIRQLATIEAYLDAGVSYTIIGTQAVREPAFVAEACKAFPGHIIVGLDAMHGRVAVEGWAEASEVLAVDLAQRFAGLGVSAIVYTDIERDGMLQGVNVEATRNLAQAVDIPVIASGGVAGIDDIKRLLPCRADGVAGVILGRALYAGTLQLTEAVSVGTAWA